MPTTYEAGGRTSDSPPENFNRLVTKKEVAQFISVTTRTIEVMVRDGRIPVIRLGRTVRFSLADVLEHIRR